MNTAIVYGGKTIDSSKIEKCAKALSKGIEEQGHMVKLLNAYRDTDARLTFEDFIIVITEPSGAISSKIPPQIEKYLKEIKGFEGKRSIAIVSGGLRANATLQTLMKTMEENGMFITYSEVINKESDAYIRAKHFRLERS